MSSFPIYLGLGSNLGDREANLHEALERIEGIGLTIARASSIYETEPVGYTDQTWFLNQVIEVRESITRESDAVDFSSQSLSIRAAKLLGELLLTENDMGRERAISDGPRVMDIDLLIYGDQIIATPPEAGVDIIVPHPRMHLRRFVLQPLSEISPDLMHPQLGKTIRELLAEVADPSKVIVYKTDK